MSSRRLAKPPLVLAVLLGLSVLVSAALPASESFTGSNGTSPPNGNWTNMDVGIQIQSNAAAGAGGGGYGFAYWSADSFNNDQFSEVKQVGSGAFGPIVRASGTNTLVMFDCNDTGGTRSFLYKRVSGSYTDISPLALLTLTFATNDVARLEVSGTTYTMYKNGASVATQSDASIASGSAGVMVLNTSATVDDWQGGDLGGGGGCTAPPSGLMLLGVGNCKGHE